MNRCMFTGILEENPSDLQFMNTNGDVFTEFALDVEKENISDIDRRKLVKKGFPPCNIVKVRLIEKDAIKYVDKLHKGDEIFVAGSLVYDELIREENEIPNIYYNNILVAQEIKLL